MSHGNATPEDARRVAHWIDQESQTRIGIRACLADLRRERDRIAKAFDKIQQERKKAKEQKSDFDITKKNQQKHCNHLHNILDGMIDGSNLSMHSKLFLINKSLYIHNENLRAIILDSCFRFISREDCCVAGARKM